MRKGVNLQLFTRLVYLKSLRQKNTTNQLPGSWSNTSTIRPVASAHRGARKCFLGNFEANKTSQNPKKQLTNPAFFILLSVEQSNNHLLDLWYGWVHHQSSMQMEVDFFELPRPLVTGNLHGSLYVLWADSF